jgi:hypothetical protein
MNELLLGADADVALPEAHCLYDSQNEHLQVKYWLLQLGLCNKNYLSLVHCVNDAVKKSSRIKVVGAQ